MSRDYKPNTKGFERFNEQQAVRLGWGIALDLVARGKVRFPGLALHGLAQALATNGAGSEAFGVAVAAYQRQEGLTEDRKLGASTWGKLVADHRDDLGAVRGLPPGYATVGGLRVHVMDRRLGELEAAFLPKPLSNFNRATAKPRRKVILHWGGWNVASCFASLENDGFSTHFMVEPYQAAAGHPLRIYQGVDLAFTAHHAVGVNEHAIGIDICRTPLIAYAGRYPDATIIDNPSNPRRGERRVLDLPDRVAEVTRALAEWVADLFAIPVGTYPGDALLEDIQGAVGIFGHHHVSARKWDVAPWAPKLWGAAK